jgi:starch synthase
MNKKIVFIATEMNPFVKTGGLADIIGSLPHELANNYQFDIRIIIPYYKIFSNNSDFEFINSFDLERIKQKADIYFCQGFNNIKIYFIKNDYFFDREYLYGYSDDAERFNYFSIAALQTLREINFKADIIHTNDWQTALVCLYLKELYLKEDFFKKTKTIFTIHNLQYQGIFNKNIIYKLKLENFFYNLEFYGNINFLKSGLVYSDKITTVSNNYALEIQTPEYGFGLDGLLRSREKDLIGILNGINYDEYKTDFDLQNINKKNEHKKKLLKKLNLIDQDNNLLISVISRFADQKGFDLIYSSLDYILNLNISLVICGKGDKNIENIFLDARDKFISKKNNFKVILTFDENLANEIYISSDVLLMPSKFEPCGLAQMIAMHYGTLPIGRDTGGLSDTIKNNINGFLFKKYDHLDLQNTIDKVINIYNKKNEWQKIIFNAMNSDFSWKKSIDKYYDIYKNLF